MADIVFHGFGVAEGRKDPESLEAMEAVGGRGRTSTRPCAYSALSSAAQFPDPGDVLLWMTRTRRSSSMRSKLVQRDRDAIKSPPRPIAPQLEKDEIGARQLGLALTLAELDEATKHGTRRAACPQGGAVLGRQARAVRSRAADGARDRDPREVSSPAATRASRTR